MKKYLSLIFIIFSLLTSCELFDIKSNYEINLITIALDYKNTDVTYLNGTINDAREFEKAMRLSCIRNKVNFSSNTYYQINENYSFDTINNQNYPKKANILLSLDNLKNNTEENSISIIYFSGHSNAGGSWLLATTDENNGTSFDTTGTIKETQLLKVKEIYEKLENIKGKILIITDSCYSGNFIKDSSYLLNEENFNFIKAFNKLLSTDKNKENIFILCATEKDNYAHEPTFTVGQRIHGYFTKALLEGLGWCDGEKGKLTFNIYDNLVDSDGIQGKLASGIPPAASNHILSVDNLFNYIKKNQDILLYSDNINIEHQYPQIANNRNDIVLFQY